MTFTCSHCEKDPNSHSFLKLSEQDGVAVMYSCPAKATLFDDYDSTMTHVEGVLAENGTKPWVLVVDSAKFGVKHAKEVKLAIDVGELITIKYGNNLKKINVINATPHIKNLFAVAWPFITDETKAMLQIV
jgi:hypothetical protein